MKIIKSASYDGMDSFVVDVETSFCKGLPTFNIVGMISTSINESKDRVKSSLLTNDFKFPPLKIIVNLSPSDINKKGTHFDLAIALQIALFDNDKIKFNDIFVFGELSLNGKIKDTNTIFAIVLSLAKQGLIKELLVCKETAIKLQNIPNITIYCVNDLNEAIEFFSNEDKSKYLFEKKH